MATQQPPPTQCTCNQACNATPAPEKPTYIDSSGAIFSIYNDKAKTFDKENVENWEGQAKGILLFTGLFSATVATFINISYPTLQEDPNVTTHSLLAQISQQLSNSTTGSTGGIASASTDSSFVPHASAVFVNLVWFLSLVLSLTCALMATLLQQWARRYLQMVRRTHTPHISAHIREYFAHGASTFGIHTLVEVLPALLLSSLALFFAGLVVFAFRVNHVVAYSTLAIVAFFSLSYIILTLMPFIFHYCPYQTPLTSLIWYITKSIPHILSYTAYHCAKRLHKLEILQGAITEEKVKSLRQSLDIKAESISEGVISMFENSAKLTSVVRYGAALRWTLSRLDEDHELEDFVSGIPGLRDSEALASYDNVDVDPRRTIIAVLAALPGPTNFRAPLPWSTMRLAQRAITSNLSQPSRRQRIKACMKALYYIPGAIRDVLAPYAAGKTFCFEILPLLNSVESLEVIDELQDTHTDRDDVALSVQCAAAVVAAFMITPPRSMLETFLAPNVPFIGDNEAGKQFLYKRLAVGTGHDVVADSDLHNDNARLLNLRRFVADIKTAIGYMDSPGWALDSAKAIHEERQALSDARKAEEYRADIFKPHGDRTSAAFIPAAQQDLIALTLEILTRDALGGAGPSQREAFLGTYREFFKVARAQAALRTPDQSLQSFSLFLEQSLPRPPTVTQLIESLASSRPRPSLTQSPEQSPPHSLALLRTPSQVQSLEPSQIWSLLQFIMHSLDLHWPQWQTPPWPQSLPQYLTHLIPLSLPQSLLQGPAPPSAHAQDMSEITGWTQARAMDDVEMATRLPQDVVEGVGVRPHIVDPPTAHDGPFPSMTPIIPQVVSAGPSRLSSVSSSSSSVQHAATHGAGSLSDSAGAFV